jgi:hypothetical protein
MNVPLVVIIVVATVAAVSAGIALTFRGFKASDQRATGNNGQHPADAAHHHHPAARHNQATNELLKRFFDGKSCTVCKKPIAPVHRTGLKPGLLNPTTHETHAWDQIPDDRASTMIETQLPLCSACVLAESFRQHFPERVVDRERSSRDRQSPDRVRTSS